MHSWLAWMDDQECLGSQEVAGTESTQVVNRSGALLLASLNLSMCCHTHSTFSLGLNFLQLPPHLCVVTCWILAVQNGYIRSLFDWLVAMLKHPQTTPTRPLRKHPHRALSRPVNPLRLVNLCENDAISDNWDWQLFIQCCPPAVFSWWRIDRPCWLACRECCHSLCVWALY